MKVRLVDRFVATLGLVALSPLFLAITVAIKLDSSGPVVHRARRVGRHGSTFVVFKFRTMKLDEASAGPKLTVRGDPRITSVGRWLRRTKLDELPQLFNVVLGQMSIVGPRPEDPHYVPRYRADQRLVLDFPPGITSPASVASRDEEAVLARLVATGLELEEAYQHVLDDKISIDDHYMSSRTIRSDLAVIVDTLRSTRHPATGGHGAAAEP